MFWNLNERAEYLVRKEISQVFGKIYYKSPQPFDAPPGLKYAAIHVRRGDKQVEAIFLPIIDYVIGIEKLVNNDREIFIDEKLKRMRVFVASDDLNGTLPQLRQLRPQWEFLYRKSAENSTGHIQDVFNALPMVKKLQKTLELITDIEFLRGSKYFVCTAGSNLCRLMQILRTAPFDTISTLDDRMEKMIELGAPALSLKGFRQARSPRFELFRYNSTRL